jgi:hypothetical protein
MYPWRSPIATGLNVTLIVQLPPAGTEAGQLLVCEKSACPVMVTVTFTLEVPLF